MKTHEDCMHRAIQISIEKMEANEGGPFGAVVVKDGEIIAEGWNQVTSSHDPTAHAEVMAIRKACEKVGHFELSDCILYTSCEPCPMCLGAIYWARPKAVYYANTRQDAADINFDDQFIYDEIERDISRREIPFHQLLSKEANAAFQKWDEKEDKVQY